MVQAHSTSDVTRSVEDTLSWSLESRHTLLAASVTAAFLFYLVLQIHEPKAKSRFPHVGVEQGFPIWSGIRQRVQWFREGPSLIHRAFKDHKDEIFTLPSLDRTSIVLPPRFLQEIKELPSTIASNSQATSDVSTVLFQRVRMSRDYKKD